MCEPDWVAPQWVETDKHAPPRGKVEWSEYVNRTGEGRRKVAKYRPGFSLLHIRHLEMDCREGEGDDRVGRFQWQGDDYTTQSDLLHRSESRRIYCVTVDDDLSIGASLGEETNMLIVIRDKSGPVHGYPVTQQEVDFKRRKYR